MFLFSVLSPLAFALDCTSLNTESCEAANAAVDQVNADAGATVMGDSVTPSRLTTLALYDKFEALRSSAVANGCTVAGTEGGTYRGSNNTWTGLWDELPAGAGGDGAGTFQAGTWQGVFDGDVTGDVGDVFSASGNGQYAGNREAGFSAGVYIRVAGSRGVFAGLYGSCSGDEATALDDWYKGDLAPPAPPVFQALQNPTAFRLQSGWEVAKLIDGNFAPNNGWANAGAADANAAVLETVVDTPIFGGGTTVVFDLHQTYNNDHGVGCFILSVTDADRSLFADGLASNGQLGDPSIWTPITVTSATATDGTVLNQFTSPDRIVAVDQNSSESIYTVVGETSVEGITGVRVDMCRDLVNISTGGPGLASNRNYVLTEFVFSAGAL